MNLFDLLKGYKQIQFDNQLLEWKIAKDILELDRRDVREDISELFEGLLPIPTDEELRDRIESLSKELKYNIEMINKTNQILNIFDEKDQNILKMRYIEGKTNSQIAHAMGYSHTTIRIRITILMEFVNLIDKYNNLNI
ncbi:hypothetical protein HMPREF2811_05470 [Globicatella sp. HMSC072A10]|uniref:sigma factor-like helix-turn-helix DNA-binding protein n=1 Tax=Globicatella sp. HMSC072A10 TaxID=1739315 RepID=UPI0008B7D42C|nr:sigma factor-like helix-turn-helix DNA-binding protein [Globicatella sp. HMSC072A10]OFK58539.1 hypothetical protein HMPREF2811_05470 [Globicatella sp. HMSC072A10]